MVRNGDCFEIVFWFMPSDAVPLFIYSPKGLDGVPEKYRTGSEPGSGKLSYWKFVTLDDNWYYCEWDM